MSKRNKFFLTHLVISVAIGLLILSLVLLGWYPAPLAEALGVYHILLILLLIDMIIGPILGFFVYKEGKKSLKIDLTVIIVLQLAALIYGLFYIYQGRPVALAFQNNQFELVRYNDIVAGDKTPEISWFNPNLVAVEMGKTAEQKNHYFSEEMRTGVMAAYRPERYIAIDTVEMQLLNEKRSLGELVKYNIQIEIDSVLKDYPTAVGWLPLRVMSGLDMVVLIDENGAVVKVVDLRPWKLA
ncbi:MULTISPECIES: TfpX/TfpZ family type IV pilin accessory protein [unclassified Acinetobacter]|uniref:TfpX/TfpZ family type IV pilin accessory protein n=1 Tax=unclassified Acinetobacter TaxID=196816 RepID=UPI0015D36437|nr:MULTISPECIES: TfpX/TfpZ family type IV pilin accessory protein [unclassified Acinetobacter]